MAGPVHALTWPGRRIRLHLDDDAMIRRVRITAGDDAKRLSGDPHTARPAHRSSSLLTATEPELLVELLGAGTAPVTGRDGQAGEQSVPQPSVLAALGERVTSDLLPADTLIRVTLTGVRYDTHRSMIEDSDAWRLTARAAAWTPGTASNTRLIALASMLARVERAVADAAVACDRRAPL